MSEHFFSGGLMPSHGMVSKIQSPLAELEKWAMNGSHYAKTCEDWLSKFYNHRREIL